MDCPKCQNRLVFRGWGNRYPPKSEALGECSVCDEKYQVRYFNGIQTSDPYQTRQPAKKTARGSYRLHPNRLAAIEAIWGSVSAFLDKADLLACMPKQYKS